MTRNYKAIQLALLFINAFLMITAIAISTADKIFSMSTLYALLLVCPQYFFLYIASHKELLEKSLSRMRNMGISFCALNALVLFTGNAMYGFVGIAAIEILLSFVAMVISLVLLKTAHKKSLTQAIES